MNKSILVIPDQHFPYNHPDIIAFLKAVARKHKPDRIVNLGDEVDYHSISFHEKSPELLSPSDELQTAINRLKALYTIFPTMDLVESNHGSLVYRKARYAGLPSRVIKSYGDILEAPKGWKWHKDLTIKCSDGSKVYFCHGKTNDVLKLSQSMGMNVVQGHYHEKFELRFWNAPAGLFWGAIAGCLIDDDSLAYSYNKLNSKRPILGCMVILKGIPQMIPMRINKKGRWTGTL